MPRLLDASDRGFTIIESAMALAMIFGVCLALLSSLATGVRGVVTGRQRSGATQLANEVLEQAKARTYDQVGHWFSDATLASDAAISGTSPNYTFGGEPLVASKLAGDRAPFSPHTATVAVDAVRYTRRVYVTQVTPASGDPYKRVTAKVTWDASQYGGSVIPNSVTLTTLLFNAAPPPDPLLEGVADAEAAHLTVTGVLAGVDLRSFELWLPYAHGEIDSSFIRLAKGFAGTARAQLNLNSGTASGCTTSADGLSAECPGAKRETVADNDGGTAPPDIDALGPDYDFGGSLSASPELSASLGTGELESASTAASCFSCFGTDVGDDDGFAYHASGATGPSALSASYAVAGVSGALAASTGSGCASQCAATALDVDRIGVNPRITSTASSIAPAIDLVTVSGAPAGYAGAVRIPSTTATAAAVAGPGAPAPATDGSSFTVQLYDTTGTPGYRTVSVTPGTAATPTPAHAQFDVGIDTVILDTAVIARAGSGASTSAGGTVSHAEAALTNWLTVTVRFQVVRFGSPLADLTIELDYGRVAASSDYAPSP